MNEKTDEDAGTIQVMLEHLNKSTLSHALTMKARVDEGELLNDYDIRFLKRALEDAKSAQPLAGRHPEYQTLLVRLDSLYDEIARKALKNEKAK